MAHFTASEVTAGASRKLHTGVVYRTSTYLWNGETASGSHSISMMQLPPGARVSHCTLGLSNNALGIVDAPGFVCTRVLTGGTVHAVLIQSASCNAVIQPFNPTYASIGYRCTASSHVVLAFTNLPASGTLSTAFTLAITYDCTLDGD